MEHSPEQFLQLPNSTRLCYQTFGARSQPAILLVAGGSESMLAWHEQFIALLRPPHNPHYIIRYDIRDTGRSTCYPISTDGSSQYTLLDLTDDAAALLQHLDVQSAHLVGFSLGGGIAFAMAGLRAPERVKSLTLISSSPIGPAPGPEDGLPPLDAELRQKLSSVPPPSDWHARDQIIRFLGHFEALMVYFPPTAAERAESAALAGRVFDRAEQNGTTVQTVFNQSGAAHQPWPRHSLLHVRCPTVIIHGRHDQNVPLPHAEALHREIAGSKLVVLEEVKHELPRRVWARVAEEIFAVMDRAQ